MEDVIYAIDQFGDAIKYERDNGDDYYWARGWGWDGGTWSPEDVKRKIDSGEVRVVTKKEWVDSLVYSITGGRG